MGLNKICLTISNKYQCKVLYNGLEKTSVRTIMSWVTRVGSCLTLRNELSEETHVLKKQETLGGGAPGQRAAGWANPGGLLHVAPGVRFCGDGIRFRLVFGQSSWLRVLPGGTRIPQPRWMPERRILGGGQTCGVSFWPFPNSSDWWWLVSSVFLTRTSQRKITHANGYYGAWPGLAVSVSVFPITVSWKRF